MRVLEFWLQSVYPAGIAGRKKHSILRTASQLQPCLLCFSLRKWKRREKTAGCKNNIPRNICARHVTSHLEREKPWRRGCRSSSAKSFLAQAIAPNTYATLTLSSQCQNVWLGVPVVTIDTENYIILVHVTSQSHIHHLFC